MDPAGHTGSQSVCVTAGPAGPEVAGDQHEGEQAEADDEHLAWCDQASDEILDARRMFGTPDYLLRVTVSDHHAYEAFLTTKLSTVPHIARVVSHQTMKNLKHQ